VTPCASLRLDGLHFGNLRNTLTGLCEYEVHEDGGSRTAWFASAVVLGPSQTLEAE
jgi:hypothetical protein